MITPEGYVNYWRFGDSTLLYDPRFLFPTEELVALAREHAGIPGLVHRDMDSDAVARVFGLEGLRVGDSGGSGSTSTSSGGLAADDGGTKGADDAGLDEHQEPGYVTVEPSSSEEQQELDYVLVGTADEVERERRREVEVERERRREADAEAAFEEGWNNQVRWIEQLLDDEHDEDEDHDDDADAEEEAAYNASRQEDSHDDVGSVELLLDLDEAEEEEEEESALTARRKKLVRDIDQSLEEEEEAGHVPRWNIAVPTIEQHFAYNNNNSEASGRPE